MNVTITINCDNAAFENRQATEIIRILKVLIAKIADGEEYAPCMDINGNKVGEMNITE